MIIKEPSPRSGKLIVTFQFPAADWAQEVHLVGDFNEWNKQRSPMCKDPAHPLWSLQLELDKGREYQFRYLVNQTSWHNDWHADKYAPNIHGSDNSVVVT